MKICPQCRTSYTDDTLQFCLQDGAPLTAATINAAGDWSEQETVISNQQPAAADKLRVDLRNPQPSLAEERQTENYPPLPVKKSNTGLVVALTVLITLLGAGAIVFGILYFRERSDDNRNEIAQNTNVRKANTAVPNANKTNQTANTNIGNANINVNVATPTPTPRPALVPEQVSEIEDNVSNVIEDWREALDNIDLEAHLGNYAPTVDYYNAGRISLSGVRADKERAFQAYDNIDMSISNVKIRPDETGQRVTAVFDKEWNFEGADKRSSGKVQQELQLTKIGGKWRITSEKDLRVY